MQNARGSKQELHFSRWGVSVVYPTFFSTRFGSVFFTECLFGKHSRRRAKASARAWRCRGEGAAEQSHAVPATLPLKPDIYDLTLNPLFRSQEHAIKYSVSLQRLRFSRLPLYPLARLGENSIDASLRIRMCQLRQDL